MDKRLARLIKTIRGQNEPVMLDTYNQAVHEDVACTIRTNINTANHHFIMEKIEVVGRKHKGQSGVVYGENGIAPTVKQVGNIIADRDGKFSNPQRGRVYDPEYIAPTQYCLGGGNQETKIVDPTIVQRGHGFNSGGEFTETAPTITGSTWHFNNILREQYRIRKLTERECLRLMGVSEEDIDKLIYHSGFTVWNGKKYVQVPA